MHKKNTISPNIWLMKTEPDVFSFYDLMNAPGRTACWEGVRNYQARNFMRDRFQIGDVALIYHSSTKIPGIAGIGRVKSKAYPDPTALNPSSEYCCELSMKRKESQWVMVDIEAVSPLPELIPLTLLRSHKGLAKMALLQRGQRLSIQPVAADEYQIILEIIEKSRFFGFASE
jgi:predicted RNA-binding protein with PUA-like domain